MDWSSYQANVCPLMLIAHHPPTLLLISAITPRPQTKGMSLNPSRNYVLTAVFRAPHYTRHFTEQLLTSQPPAAVPDEAELRPPRSAPRAVQGRRQGLADTLLGDPRQDAPSARMRWGPCSCESKGLSAHQAPGPPICNGGRTLPSRNGKLRLQQRGRSWEPVVQSLHVR